MRVGGAGRRVEAERTGRSAAEQSARPTLGAAGASTPAARAFTADGEKKWKVAPPGVEVIANPELRRRGATAQTTTWIEKWQSPKTGKWVHNYTVAARLERQTAKFEENRAFAKTLPQIRARYTADLRSRGKERVLALIVALIDQAYFRVGNEESEGRGVYGVTTLCRAHLRLDGDTARFDYVGKHQVEQHKIVVDRRLAGILRELRGECRRASDRLFRFEGRTISAADVNAYLAEFGATAKSFRTFHATRLAREGLLARGPVAPAARAEVASAVVAEVAEALGHTPAVCREHYVDRVVLQAFEKGRLR